MATLPRLSKRHAESHKGTYGRVLVIAGRRGMVGAAVLTGTAALRSGAGLVTVACPDTILDTVAAGFPCYSTFALPVNDRGDLANSAADVLVSFSEAFDVIAIGPGLGTGDGAALAVRSLLMRLAKPIVIDADGLNVLVPLSDELMNRIAPTILTPHPGEFARLTGRPSPTTESDRITVATAFASQQHCILVLKGHRSIVADGTRHHINTTGNPGMATGGSGDVLTGVIAALIGQNLSAFDAAVLGVHIHGLAGDIAAATFGETSLTAFDLLNSLPAAFLDMSATSPES